MQTCPDTIDLLGEPPAGPVPCDGCAGLAAPLVAANSEKARGRRSAEEIQVDLAARYLADLERLNARYAVKIGGVAARVRPVAERRKDALVRLDRLRDVVRRTNPLLDEAALDGLIFDAVARTYGDLADAAGLSVPSMAETVAGR